MTREEATNALRALSAGLDKPDSPARLLERVSRRADSAELRDLLCEWGARATVQGFYFDQVKGSTVEAAQAAPSTPRRLQWLLKS